MAIPTYYQFAHDELMASAGFGDESIYSEALVQGLLTESAGFCESSFWLAATASGQDRQYLGILYRTAHKLLLLRHWGIVGSGGTAGALGGLALGIPTSLSSSQGSQSVSFSRAGLDSSGDPDTEYRLTYFGQQFIALRDSGVPVTGFVY